MTVLALNYLWLLVLKPKFKANRFMVFSVLNSEIRFASWIFYAFNSYFLIIVFAFDPIKNAKLPLMHFYFGVRKDLLALGEEHTS